jgi:5-methylcytosine-specific restriction endonuclease McrA
MRKSELKPGKPLARTPGPKRSRRERSKDWNAVLRLRDVTCPDCGLVREVWAETDDQRCRSCATRAKRTGATVVCVVCGVEFYARASEMQRGRKFCSSDCRVVGQAGRFNPNYRHGESAKNSRVTGFNLKAKGEAECRHCGRRAVHAHHAVPRSKTRAGHADLRNLMPLCAECHSGWHERRLSIWRDRFTPDEDAFVVEIAGEWWVDKNYPRRPDEELRRMYAEAHGHPADAQWRFCKEGDEGGPDAVRLASECSIVAAFRRATGSYPVSEAA